MWMACPWNWNANSQDTWETLDQSLHEFKIKILLILIIIKNEFKIKY